MSNFILCEGWDFKEMFELPWYYGSGLGFNEGFFIKGESGFSFEDGGDKINLVKRILLHSGNILVMDTGEDCYYTCHFIPKKLIKKIKKGSKIEILVENIYNDKTNHYSMPLVCQ